MGCIYQLDAQELQPLDISVNQVYKSLIGYAKENEKGRCEGKEAQNYPIMYTRKVLSRYFKCANPDELQYKLLLSGQN